MAKEKKPAEREKHSEGGGKKKLHLHEIRSTYAKDGSIVHSHTYKDHADSPHMHPERGPMATSTSPEEAGQHVAEQFGMNQQGAEPEGDELQGGGTATAPGGQQAAPPGE